MASMFKVVYTVASNAATVKGKLRLLASGSSVSAAEMAQRLASYTDAMGGGMYTGNILVNTTAVQAAGTVTLSSMVATDTITINGTVFTCVASGATGNQFNVGGSDTLTAVAAAAAINASATANVSKVVAATSAAAVITVTAITPGYAGNQCTLAISAHGSVSGAKLTGGSEDSTVIINNS